jgi:hypothetical protein
MKHIFSRTRTHACGKEKMMFNNAWIDPKLRVELMRIAPMQEAARLSSLSEDTLEREFADKIVWLSTRRKGMRVGDALMINTDKKDSA